jgi:apoptosis-inducing factor 3
MASQEATPKGPDLGAGVPFDSLTDGVPLVGRAGGDQVLLVRRGNDVFAIGATCSHYGGPLGDGLVVGDTVRCPYHHARFDLKTGQAIGCPALNGVPSYRIERAGNLVVVRSKVEAASPATMPSGVPSSIVIVGAGAAGHVAAETLRRYGYGQPIVIVGAEETVPCDRPNLSKDYLAGTAPEEWLPLRTPDWYAEKRIDIRLGVAVKSIDVAANRVQLEGGKVLDYGGLLLATGAEPTRLSIPGGELPHVRYLRTLSDSRAIITRAQTAKRAVVIGASFIGLEAAASLRTRGLEVHVVGPESRPLERVLGAEIGDFVRALHEEHGVVFHLGQTPESIDADGVVLKSGDKLPADLVVVGIGVRPNTALAERAGIRTDRGILVDAYLETNVPGVYAAGDVARYPDPKTGDLVRIEHWVHAQRMGQCAAKNLLGKREPFTDVPFFWSQHYDVPIAYVGHAEKWDRIDKTGSAPGRDLVQAFRRGDDTLAVATIYRDKESLEAELAMETGDKGLLRAAIGV